MSQVTKVIDGGLVATLHLPRESGRRPAVIVLSGSDGGIATANMFGEPLAASGFVTMCLAYFAMDGLPRNFSQIPLEYFEKAIGWLRAHPAVDAERVAVFGMSRGGEAALLVAATFPAIKAVVASVPSHVVWQGTNPDPSIKTSSFTRAGVELPYASLVVGTRRHDVARVVRCQPQNSAAGSGDSRRANQRPSLVRQRHSRRRLAVQRDG